MGSVTTCPFKLPTSSQIIGEGKEVSSCFTVNPSDSKEDVY